MEVKEFNRSTVTEISDRIQNSLSELAKEYGIDLNVNGGRFDKGKFTLKLEGILITKDGAVVAPEYKHSIANSALASEGIFFLGNVIGSSWQIRGDIYTVMDYVTKRPKYPFSLKRSDGRLSKSSIGFIKQGVQITQPTLSEFVTWFTVDPDSDAVLESDVVICDRVCEFLSGSISPKDIDKFFKLVDDMNDKFTLKKLRLFAKEIYHSTCKTSFREVGDAITYMKTVLKKGK